MTRLLRTTERSHQIIEIGAGYSPVAPKSEGWLTHVVDHACRDDLRQKYANVGVDPLAIEDVDSIWMGGPLHEAVPAALLGQVDTIIASHVLEHIPDLIGFFNSASRLVHLQGSLSVALPDRRYCFDCLKPWSTTGDLLDAQDRGTGRHSIKTAFNHMAYSAVVGGNLAWGPYPVSPPALMDPFEVAAHTVATFQQAAAGAYQDYHAWQFTPAGFQLAMLELAELGLTDWRLDTLEGPENFEFFAVLRRGVRKFPNARELQAERRDLLVRQLEEAREQIDFMLGEVDRSAASKSGADDLYDGLAARIAEHEDKLQLIEARLTGRGGAASPIRTVWRALRERRLSRWFERAPGGSA